jgi:hypothetical protein
MDAEGGTAFVVFSVSEGVEEAFAGGGVGLRNIKKTARRTRARTPPVLPPKRRIRVFGSITFAAGLTARAAVPLGGFRRAPGAWARGAGTAGSGFGAASTVYLLRMSFSV